MNRSVSRIEYEDGRHEFELRFLRTDDRSTERSLKCGRVLSYTKRGSRRYFLIPSKDIPRVTMRKHGARVFVFEKKKDDVRVLLRFVAASSCPVDEELGTSLGTLSACCSSFFFFVSNRGGVERKESGEEERVIGGRSSRRED